MTETYLDNILASHRAAKVDDQRSPDQLVERCADLPATRDFAAALRAPGLSVIAEVKRRSPSKLSLIHI